MVFFFFWPTNCVSFDFFQLVWQGWPFLFFSNIYFFPLISDLLYIFKSLAEFFFNLKGYYLIYIYIYIYICVCVLDYLPWWNEFSEKLLEGNISGCHSEKEKETIDFVIWYTLGRTCVSSICGWPLLRSGHFVLLACIYTILIHIWHTISPDSSVQKLGCILCRRSILLTFYLATCLTIFEMGLLKVSYTYMLDINWKIPLACCIICMGGITGCTSPKVNRTPMPSRNVTHILWMA